MKAINRNLCILFIFLLSIGSGVFFSFKKDSQQVRENQKEGLVLIDRLGIAIRSAILQFKMLPITIASGARIQNYGTKPPTNEWHVEYAYSWGSDVETAHEGGIGVREYDWYGNYKEVTAKQSSDGTCEGNYNVGYERKMDQSRKDRDLKLDMFAE